MTLFQELIRENTANTMALTHIHVVHNKLKDKYLYDKNITKLCAEYSIFIPKYHKVGWAIENGYVEALKYLYTNDIDNEIDWSIIEPYVRHAIRERKFNVVKYLVEQKLFKITNWMIRYPVESGDIGMLSFVLTLDEESSTYAHIDDEYALRYAARYGYLNIVRYLVEIHNADIHAQDDEALRLAAQSRYSDVVKYLVSKGANIHARNDSAICSASYYGRFDNVKYLVECGANIHARNDEPLRLATLYDYFEIAKYLIICGANIHALNHQDSVNDRVLQWADRNGYL